MSEVRGFFDAQCNRCRRKMGWSGTYRDRPACYHCGAPPPEFNEEENAAMEAFLQTLRDKHLNDDEGEADAPRD